MNKPTGMVRDRESDNVAARRHWPACAVVVPCYRVAGQILDVLNGIGPEVEHIICVDDACPDRSGEYIRQNCHDPRVEVVSHAQNQGVGGAMITGYRRALERDVEIVVKLDGDGQMDPALIFNLVYPIANELADYT